MVEYLKTPIVEVRETDIPRYGITVYGYTVNSGAPMSKMIRLEGEKRWRRLMVVCFSNAGSYFVRILGKRFYVNRYDLPEENES